MQQFHFVLSVTVRSAAMLLSEVPKHNRVRIRSSRDLDESERTIVKQSPLHAMEALGGRGGVAPTHFRPRHWMGVSGQRHAPAALLPPGKGPGGTHCTGGWMGPRAGLDTEARGKILYPDRPVVQPVVRHYTAWANPAPRKDDSTELKNESGACGMYFAYK
jgi:hypothetical protein